MAARRTTERREIAFYHGFLNALALVLLVGPLAALTVWYLVTVLAGVQWP